MKVGDVMTRDVVTASEDASVAEVAELMQEHNISSVPVLDRAGKLTGIVSEGDLVRELLPQYGEMIQEDRYRVDPEYPEQRAAELRHRPVKGIMTRPVITTTEATALLRAAAMLQLKRIKRLDVV
ncbi:MAG: CBS domain-containing protein [Armatimonadota bacterium]|nr:MAG: CBS domain-containing protein [Armatimonadota bacterium]